MERLLEDILTSKEEQQVIALRTLKNQIIGYSERKKYFIEHQILSILIHILSSPETLEESQIQAIFILTSLAQVGYSFTSRICQAGTLHHLFMIFITKTSSPILITASLKALATILASASIAVTIPEPAIHHFVKILAKCCNQSSTPSEYFQASLVASIISACGKVPSQQNQLAQSGILDILIEIVSLFQDRSNQKPQQHFYRTKLLDAVLHALSSLTHNHDAHASQVAASYRSSTSNNPNDVYPMITNLLKLAKDPCISIQLGASGCLANMYRSGAIPKKYSTDLELIVIPILIRLLDESYKVKEHSLLILAYLVTDSDEMQGAACDADVIRKLANILHHVNNNPSPEMDNTNDKIIEAVLLAIAALTLFKDDYRKQVINAKIVPHIVSALSHQSAEVRVAACQCTRSLSRSVCILRSNLVDAGITDPLFVLLTDENLKVKTAACAAVCNLVLDFSPMRSAILEKGALKIMCEHAKNENSALRLNAVWALKHIVYAAETSVKKNVLEELGYNVLTELCNDPEVSVQEQALDVIRNVICGQQENIDILLNNIGVSKILSIIKKKLSSDFTEIITAVI
ncbi:hypothetical protein PNEG_00804 [Pneumocystis murina B123]|uniref:Uncharacterized protein n=1 Tax=Pneumocystis murina (strain B123) TaxID=1069680 RepID=M7PBF4_PNEMU|nr:hypothetical protein PNEG_00804 [Pneumocystis murina B123]EMR11215.1 hypothetical protein PNEG_00804 [Pneumocystis murina B123]